MCTVVMGYCSVSVGPDFTQAFNRVFSGCSLQRKNIPFWVLVWCRFLKCTVCMLHMQKLVGLGHACPPEILKKTSQNC